MRPTAQHDRLAQESAALEAEMMAELKWPVRRLARRVLRGARLHMQSRERAKTTIVRAIHGARLRGQELDRRLVERSGGQRGDLWFLLREELDDYIADPSSFLPTIAERRDLHDRLSERIPPFYVQGEMPPLDEWELRSATVEQLRVGDTITGLSGCVGIGPAVEPESSPIRATRAVSSPVTCSWHHTPTRAGRRCSFRPRRSSSTSVRR